VTRFVSAPFAAATTLVAVAWGPPNFATPMPSWYNLFFATFGVAALLRYIEVQSRRWLLIAGICGGISFLFKMTGLYFVAGVLLFLPFREQMRRSTIQQTKVRENVWYRWFVLLSICLYEALLFALLRKQANAATYLGLWLPNLAVGATVIGYEFCPASTKTGRFSFLFRELTPFGAGVAFPILIFLIPYSLTGSLGQFFSDLFIQPVGLVRSGSIKPPVNWFVEGCVANLLLVAVVLLTRSKSAPKLWEFALFGVPIALLIPLALSIARQSNAFYHLVWCTIWVLAPVATVLGVELLRRWRTLNRLEFMRDQRLFMVLSVTAACSLIQFPFFHSIYYCYVAPLVFLSVIALVSLMDQPPWLGVSGMLCFCLFYAVLELKPGYVPLFGVKFQPDIQTVPLSLSRTAGILVSSASADEFEKLDTVIREHARGEYILAASNCAEVYFLSGLRPPVKDFYGFGGDFRNANQGILGALQSHHVNLVVLNHEDSIFVRPAPAELREALEREFPGRTDTAHFELRWRP
jgi:Dolichyl-phosphate-mannose-protein mannosyltransferase